MSLPTTQLHHFAQTPTQLFIQSANRYLRNREGINMLWACLHLPKLPLEVFTQQQIIDAAFVIETTHKNKRQVLFANDLAEEAGIITGTSMPTAHSLCSDLQAKSRDLQQEANTLRNLTIWAYQFTPNVSMQDNFCILLELKSCLRLFDGLINLDQTLRKAANQLNYSYQLSYGATPLAAQLLAQHQSIQSHSETIILNNCVDTLLTQQNRKLNDLPVTALNYQNKTHELLHGMGIRSLQKVLELPKDALGQRFGEDFLDYLDKLTGKRPDPQQSFHLPLHFRDGCHFVSELEHQQWLLHPIKQSLQKLCNYLTARQKLIDRLELTFNFRNKDQESLTIKLAKPSKSYQHILELINLKLEGYELADPVIGTALEAKQFCDIPSQDNDLFENTAQAKKNTNCFELVSFLQAGLGENQVCSIFTKDDHRPERSWSNRIPKVSQFTAPSKSSSPNAPTQSARPLWLLNQPKPLSIKKDMPYLKGTLALLNGPERIETGWWDQQPVNRDYFIAQNNSGEHYWIYQDRSQQNQWFLHGIFS